MSANDLSFSMQINTGNTEQKMATLVNLLEQVEKGVEEVQSVVTKNNFASRSMARTWDDLAKLSTALQTSLKDQTRTMGLWDGRVKAGLNTGMKAKLLQKDYAAEVKKTNKRLFEVNKEINKYTKRGKLANAVNKALGISTANLTKKEKGLTVVKKLLRTSLKGNIKLLKLTTKHLIAMPIKKTAKALGQMTASMLGLNAAMRMVGGSGASLGDMFGALVEKIGSAVRKLTVDSIKLFTSLDTSARKTIIFAGLGKDEEGNFNTDLAQEQVKLLTESFNRLATVSLFSSEQIATAYEEIAAIGMFDTAEQLEAIGVAMVGLATATGTENITNVGKVLLQMTNAFQLGMENAGAVADLLAVVANETALSVSEIGFSMQRVAGLSNILGISIQGTAALLGQLSNMGVAASVAGTTLAEAFRKMSNPTAQAQAQMDKLGLTFFDAQGNMLDMATEILPQLNRAFDQLTRQEQAVALDEMFGTRGGVAIAQLMNGVEGLVDLNERFADSVGTVSTGVDFMMGGLEGAMQALKGTFETIKTELGEALAPALIEIAEVLTTLFQSEEMQTFMSNLGSLISQLLTGLMPVLMALFNVVNKVFSAFFDNEELMDTIMAIFSELAMIVNILAPIIAELVTQLLGALLPIILELVRVIGDALNVIFVENKDIIMELIGTVVNLIQTLGRILMPIIKVLIGVILDLLPTIMEFATDIIDLVAVLIEGFVPVLKFAVWIIIMLAQAIKPLIELLGWLARGITYSMEKTREWSDAIWDDLTPALEKAGADILTWAMRQGWWNQQMQDTIDLTNELYNATKGMTDTTAGESIAEANDELEDFIENFDDAFGEGIDFDFSGQELPVFLVDGNGLPLDELELGVDSRGLERTFAEFINDFRGSSISDIIDLEELGTFAGVADLEGEKEKNVYVDNVNVELVQTEENEDADIVAEKMKIELLSPNTYFRGRGLR